MRGFLISWSDSSGSLNCRVIIIVGKVMVNDKKRPGEKEIFGDLYKLFIHPF
ncbi:hypothetical protein HanPSC8_Chr07g0301801 [Helianthus annuus]|nr:hypothetical protein HanPSC8_Chr07g0301801 [Helianthus annuus]